MINSILLNVPKVRVCSKFASYLQIAEKVTNGLIAAVLITFRKVAHCTIITNITAVTVVKI